MTCGEKFPIRAKCAPYSQVFPYVQQIQSNVCISNRLKWLYTAEGLQASRMQQHVLLNVVDAANVIPSPLVGGD